MNTFDAYIKYVPQTLFGINFCLQTAAMESMEKIGVFILSAEAAPLVEELIGASKNVGELYDSWKFTCVQTVASVPWVFTWRGSTP